MQGKGSEARFAVFDLDDTLFATERAERRARKSLRSLGIEPHAFATADKRWWNRFEAHECTLAEFRHGRFLDCGLHPEQVTQADDSYRVIANSISFRVGAARILQTFECSGFQTVILTNAPWHELREQSLQPVLRHVKSVVYAGDHEVRKPNPEAFVSALRKLDGHPEAAVSVGDRFHSISSQRSISGFSAHSG